VKVAVLGIGGNKAMRIGMALAALGRSARFIAPSDIGAGRSERNLQLELYAQALQHAGPLTMPELTAALPPSDDPFKPCRRSKGEKARNRKQRRG
jgi:hypothetical protein